MPRRSTEPSLANAACLAAQPTATIARALATAGNHTANADLLFLEAWERRAGAELATLLRIAQIRRANPALAAELRAELANGRPLTRAERRKLRFSTAPPLVFCPRVASNGALHAWSGDKNGDGRE